MGRFNDITGASGEAVPEAFEPPPGLAVAARARSLREASDQGLAILAMGRPYWMFGSEGGFVLCVDASAAASVRRELEVCRRLDERKEAAAEGIAPRRVRVAPFALYAVVLIAFFAAQQRFGGAVAELGRLDARRVLEAGEGWRVVTGLTLHADAAHLLSNLVGGLGFGFWLARYLGAAWAWSLIALAGIAGNALTVAVYAPDPHLSLGASTAVFGAVGLLTGFGWRHARSEPERESVMPEWLIPPLAGLTLLGMLGNGGPRTDVVAHISGFLAGVGIAWLFGRAFGLSHKRGFARWAGALPLAAVGAAWLWASAAASPG